MMNTNGLPKPTKELIASIREDLPSFRALREQANLTQADVAAETGVTHSAVAHWEAGRRVPTGLAASALRVMMDRLKENENVEVST